MFIDTHAHLDMLDDQEAVLARATEAGVDRIINIGHSVEHAVKALANAERFSNVYATFGVHPCYLDAYKSGQLDDFANRFSSGSSKIVALGEVGLDYYHMRSQPDFQKSVFEEMLSMAKDLGLPVVIHCRDKDGKEDAYMDLLPILKKIGNEKVVMHCYSGSLEFARKWWELGYLTSFTGVVTYKSYDLDILREAPRYRIMIETDCPYLLPRPNRGREKCEPKHVVKVAEKIAEVWEVSVEEVAELTTKNAEHFFNL